MIAPNALLGLVGQYGSANVKFALALAGTGDEVMATNAVLDVHQQISQAIDEVYAENERLEATIKGQDERIIQQQTDIYRLWNALHVLYIDANVDGPRQMISDKAIALAHGTLTRI